MSNIRTVIVRNRILTLLLAATASASGFAYGETSNDSAYLQLVDATRFIANYKQMAAISAKVFAVRAKGSDKEFASVMATVASADLSDTRQCISQAYASSSLSPTDAKELAEIFRTPIGIKVLDLSQQMLVDDIERGSHKPIDPSLLTEPERKELFQVYQRPVFARYSRLVVGPTFQAAAGACILSSKAIKASGAKF